MRIPLRQKLARFLECNIPIIEQNGYHIEKFIALKLIPFVAGKEPWYWIHYGKNCVCCERGWHK